MFINNWDGYFICPNCKRIHSWDKIKKELIVVPFCRRHTGDPFQGDDTTEFKCVYCGGLICGFERSCSKGYLYNSRGIIKEYRVFTETGRLVYIY